MSIEKKAKMCQNQCELCPLGRVVTWMQRSRRFYEGASTCIITHAHPAACLKIQRVVPQKEKKKSLKSFLSNTLDDHKIKKEIPQSIQRTANIQRRNQTKTKDPRSTYHSHNVKWFQVFSNALATPVCLLVEFFWNAI